MTELKPCPFCGGEAEIVNHTTHTIPIGLSAYVQCKKCKASGKSFEQGCYNYDIRYIFKAIDAWNGRGGI